MKNTVGILSLTAATCAIGWSFGSGAMDGAACLALILSWIGISWSCMQD